MHIKNVAIIEELSLEFGVGFIVLTGETGAGKSILIDGLNLALGERADRNMIRAGYEEACVEALFDLRNLPAVKDQLTALQVPLMEDELLLRRVITAAGKSRCSANGSPVPLGLLKKLGDQLVDLHGQHEHQLLLNDAMHLEFLDAFGGLLPQRAGVREAFRAWRARQEELERLSTQGREKVQRLDLLNYQINEITAVHLAPGEGEKLAAEKLRLAHVQKLTEALAHAHESLLGEDGARELIGRAASALKGVVEFDRDRVGPGLDSLVRLGDTVQDEATALRELLEKLEADPKRLEDIEERLDVISRLQRKYGDTVEAVLAHLERAQAEAAELTSSEENLAALKTRLEELWRGLSSQATRLSADRQRAATKFASQVARQLRELVMEQADFGVRCSQRECTAEGIDVVEFELAPNVGEGTKPLKAIASGGELSRIMLAIKSVLAGVDRVGTLVFDEIDAGIGGKVAEVAGRKLKEIGAARQVLCITHLPQIAARAEEHVVVRKQVAKGQTKVMVTKLEGKERVEELARMLAGEEITATALQHAEVLLRGG